MTQVPNYLQELYVSLLPLGLLSFSEARCVWVGINLLLTVFCVWLLRRVYGLNSARALFLGLLLVASTPFRIAVGNGQMAILETFLLVAILGTSNGRGVVLGLSYFKYSFSPVFAIYMAFRRRWSWLVVSFAVPVAGLILFWLLTHGSVFREALEPLLVNRDKGVAKGAGDIMTVTYYVGRYLGWMHLSGFDAFLAALGSVILGGVVAMRGGIDRNSFPALTCASLMLFVHLSYDFVVLAIPVAALLSWETSESMGISAVRRALAIASISLLWFVLPSLTRVLPWVPEQYVVGATLITLTLCFGCILPIAEETAEIYKAQPAGNL